MTLIIGLNYSNKLCIAGDSRVTRKSSDGKVVYLDNILKLSPLWGKEIKDQSSFNDDALSVGVAGSVPFANYLVQNIKRLLNKGQIGTDIRDLNNQIEDVIRSLTDEWLKNNSLKSASVALIIAGMTKNRRKRISSEKLDELIVLYNEQKKRDKPGLNKFLKEDFPNNPIWQKLEEKLLKDRGKGVAELLVEGDEPTVSDWIQKALDTNSEYVDMPDSLVIGIEVSPLHGILKKETAEWGEFIAYGAGLFKEDLPSDLLAIQELSHTQDPKSKPELWEAAILSRSILDIAKEKELEIIGGSPILLRTSSDGDMSIQANGLTNDDKGRFLFNVHGHILPMMSFNDLIEIKNPPNNSEIDELEM